MPGFPTHIVGTPTNRGSFDFAQDKKARRYNGKSGPASSGFRTKGLDVASELETVFEEAEIGDKSFGAGGFDFGDDGLQAFAGDCAANHGSEFIDGTDGTGLRDAGGASDTFEIGAGARGGGKAADGEETLVVKNYMKEIFWFVACEGAQGAEIHEEGAVTIEDDDFLMGQGKREAETGGRGESHGVLQIEKIGTMAERLEFGGQGSHDGDDETVFEVGINRAKAIEAQHHSSHIRSRVRRRATG